MSALRLNLSAFQLFLCVYVFCLLPCVSAVCLCCVCFAAVAGGSVLFAVGYIEVMQTEAFFRHLFFFFSNRESRLLGSVCSKSSLRPLFISVWTFSWVCSGVLVVAEIAAAV